jgi:hypothetical protein
MIPKTDRPVLVHEVNTHGQVFHQMPERPGLSSKLENMTRRAVFQFHRQ